VKTQIRGINVPFSVKALSVYIFFQEKANDHLGLLNDDGEISTIVKYCVSVKVLQEIIICVNHS